MKLEELKIIDVIKMPLFAEQVKACLDDLRTFIKGIGDAAFYRTMQLLKAEEEYHAKNSEQNEKDS